MCMFLDKRGVLNSLFTDDSGGKRQLWIDGLRGLSMLVIVYYHCLLGKSRTDYSTLFVFLGPLNVSLFFVISAFLFSSRGGDEKKFFKYIFFRLVIPWLIIGSFPYYNFVDQFPRLLSGEKLWFMPALIIAEIVWFFIHKYTKKERWIIIYGLIVSSIGLVFYDIGFLNYGMINRALTVQWLFVVGYILRVHQEMLFNAIKNVMMYVSLLFIILGIIFCVLYPNQFFDVHLNKYYFIPLTWTYIILGVLISFYWFKTCKKTSRLLKIIALVGQNTLMIYMFSGWVLRLFSSYRNVTPVYIYPFFAFFEMLIVVTICLTLSLLANQYMPLIVGRKRL